MYSLYEDSRLTLHTVARLRHTVGVRNANRSDDWITMLKKDTRPLGCALRLDFVKRFTFNGISYDLQKSTRLGGF